ncbi:glycosyl hydrolase family 28-related protein [Hufsiella ginkgonis]|uniref:Gluconolaconase n=1 Tax=Hufsiella ginkgonis TaxID=2695274 RepID=A0A7K1Y1Y1_9SPHI|nr:glycosyl hydrolase family 28-related protein [Hufsiella ginkgonis]MXV17088.1 gluconolaconase [Hufsiella ginkgonis]
MKRVLVTCCCLLVVIVAAAATPKSRSFYQQRLWDPDAVYFTPGNFKISADGKADVSDALQEAINQVKIKYNFGVLFIPEGTYLLSKTICIPQAVRVIGYGKNRPVFVLGKSSPGFREADPGMKGQAKYLFWFTGGIVQPGQSPRDAGAGTFYSALSNVDIRIEDGNPAAVALRAHFAQHSFIAHVDVNIGNGKAGLFDVGNEMEDVRFFGGDYGIYTTKPSPGWQYMMVDTYFEGQRKAAIKTQEAGLTIVRLQAKNVPTVIEIDPNYHEKLFMEDCLFDKVTGPAIVISNEGNAFNQVSLRNVVCRNVPVLASYRRSGKQTPGKGAIYRISNFIYGLHIDGIDAAPVFKTTEDLTQLNALPAEAVKDIPELPAIQTWANLKTLGAKGDGETDDTRAIQEAVDKYPAVYVPQGWYRITETIRLKPNTVLIGLNPVATQFILADNTEAFGSFGQPKAMVEAPVNGTNILTGIGLSTGAWNNRAVACKWMAGEKSYMNDVKFIGGHGTMNRPGPQGGSQNRGSGFNQQPSRVLQGMDVAWDTQYWSLWITNGGGGTFKDIWTANTFATSGMYISNTATPGRIYAMSVEHHVRNEVRFKNVSNWKIYALQLEEESRESSNAQPVELDNCSNMVFANLYMFRVIRVNTPFSAGVRTWDPQNIEFLNVHNYSQTKYTTTLPIYDINSDKEIRPWEFVRLKLDKSTVPASPAQVRLLAKGFEFADGMCSDSKGNVYFSETRLKRIYRWSAASRSLSLLADFPWEPLSLACDKNDQLLVVFKYTPRPGYLVNGKPEVFPLPEDAGGTSFSGWGNSGFGTLVYSVDPEHPEETMTALKKVPMGSIADVYKALYPANRWRDYHDFNTVTVARPKEAFVAPDGVTIIPVVYDLARSNSLAEAFPGKPVYLADEYDKRTVKCSVDAAGYLSDLTYFVENGEYSSATDAQGNLYVADGEIYVFDRTGKQTGVIKTPERPVTIAFGGKEREYLFFTGRSGFYQTKIR